MYLYIGLIFFCLFLRDLELPRPIRWANVFWLTMAFVFIMITWPIKFGIMFVRGLLEL